MPFSSGLFGSLLCNRAVGMLRSVRAFVSQALSELVRDRFGQDCERGGGWRLGKEAYVRSDS